MTCRLSHVPKQASKPSAFASIECRDRLGLKAPDAVAAAALGQIQGAVGGFEPGPERGRGASQGSQAEADRAAQPGDGGEFQRSDAGAQAFGQGLGLGTGAVQPSM